MGNEDVNIGKLPMPFNFSFNMANQVDLEEINVEPNEDSSDRNIGLSISQSITVDETPENTRTDPPERR